MENNSYDNFEPLLQIGPSGLVIWCHLWQTKQIGHTRVLYSKDSVADLHWTEHQDFVVWFC